MSQIEQVGIEGEAGHDAPALRRAGSRPVAVVCFIAVAMLVVGLDLGIKYTAFEHVAGQPVILDAGIEHPAHVVPLHSPVDVVPGVLSLHLTLNDGAVFGIWSGGRWVFIVVSVLAVGVLLRLFWRSPADAWVYHLGLALVLGGAMGNLYDRMRYGVVRDMFRLFPETGLWPWIFNLADAALMAGVALVVIMIYLHERRSQQQRRAQAPQTDRG
ncbi:MAG: signal peptidase II [Phycisphaeraceae bacterium]